MTNKWRWIGIALAFTSLLSILVFVFPSPIIPGADAKIGPVQANLIILFLVVGLLGVYIVQKTSNISELKITLKKFIFVLILCLLSLVLILISLHVYIPGRWRQHIREFRWAIDGLVLAIAIYNFFVWRNELAIQSTFVNKIKAALFFIRSKYRIYQDACLLSFIIFFGLLLLYGRYDWSPEVTRFSLRGYVSSAYLFVVTIPTVFFLLKNFLPNHKNWTWGISFTVVSIFCLPYRWLNLDKLYYYRENPVIYNSIDYADIIAGSQSPKYTQSPPPSTNWLPDAWLRLNDMPSERLFFFILIAAGILVLIAYLKGAAMRAYEVSRVQKNIWLWFGLFLLILFQTYLHLSLRSPYTYLTHYERPPEQNYWYAKFMFPNNQGGVNADLPFFRALEEHFIGVPHETDTMLIRRAFPFYISSQFSYFFGMYWVFLILNILFWFVACLCAYFLGRSWRNAEVGTYMAFLVGCGPGFIMYVAQPMNYLPGYAVIVILIYLFERLVVAQPDQRIGRYILFGALLGLGLLVYDLFTWYAFFLFYSLLRQISIKHILVSLVVAFVVYQGFLWIQTGILHITLSIGNTILLDNTFHNLRDLIAQRQVHKIYMLTLDFMGVFLNQLGHVFFIVPLVLALLGLFILQDRYQVRLISFSLFIPSLLGFAFLYYGSSVLSGLPRLNYGAYPAVYMLASCMLMEMREFLVQKIRPWIGSLAIWLILGFIFVLSNVDAFGILPQLYYYIYYMSGGVF